MSAPRNPSALPTQDHRRDSAPSHPHVIEITRVLDAPRALVWKAWTDPEQVARWWGPEGFTTTVSELDLRPGGRTSYTMHGPDGAQYPVCGVFREIVPEERIVTTDEFGEGFEAPDGIELPDGIVLTVLFEALSESRTKLTLLIAHTSAESLRKHEEMGVVAGWNSSIDCLAGHLAEQQPSDASFAVSLPSDREIRITRRFDAPRALVFDAFSKPEHIRHWWGSDGAEVDIKQFDFREGGEWSIAVRMADGSIHPFRGEFREIAAPRRIVQTFIYDIDFIRDHPSLETLELEERDGKTYLTATVLHDSRESRDGHFHSGVESGTRAAYGRLAELVEAKR